MKVQVHNISNRSYVQCPSMCVTIGGIKIRPGKYELIPAESINTKTEQLHGSLIWIGTLPKTLQREEPLPPKQDLCMGPEQVRLYLSALTREQLINLASSVTPSLNLNESTLTRRYVYAIASACFSSEYELVPEDFFWLGKWKKQSNGDYIEV